jgi:geranylgeranyl diphosphate synthase type II
VYEASAAVKSVAQGREPMPRAERSGPPTAAALRCPESKAIRERLRAMAVDLVSPWRSAGVPAAARTAAGLRGCAETLVKRAAASPEHVGWTMVTIVSEFWRDRLAAAASGRRLLLLPDCPAASPASDDATGSVPRVCGPSCGIATIWSAARDCGWVVEPVGRAVAGIGSLLTGQYDGVLGIARLNDLEKAFAMLPAFSLPVAAVPFDPPSGHARGGCAESLATAAIDVEWVLGLVGVAGGGATPVGDYLPLLREAAEMFASENLVTLQERLSLGPVFGPGFGTGFGAAFGAGFGGTGQRPVTLGGVAPLDATACMATDFLARGGKFLRPFICLAAYDALRIDLGAVGRDANRDSAKAASVAIEIFHKASLVHDDIEDQDLMRYGRPTLHVDHGVPAAINAGDYLLGLGYRIVSALPDVDAATLRDLVAILADAHVRLAQGQGAELWWRDGGDKRLTPGEALTIYGLKTSPAFEAAVAMGIRLAGIQPVEAGDIGAYSLHVGNGFQVLNDLKDWSGDLENNRRAAGDLLGGRPTVMWALALERLAAEDADMLQQQARAAARPDADEATVIAAVAEVRRLYTKAGVFERAADIVAEQRALAAAAAATCRWRRLRDVLEFLLDLAVPELAATQFSA